MRILAMCCAAMLVTAGCGSGDQPPKDTPPADKTPAVQPSGQALSASDIAELAAQFQDAPLTGGQVAPRSYRWINDRVAVFLQFDNSDPAQAKALRYIGISVKGVFCAEDQPGGPEGGFPHFHRLDAPVYAQGHGGPAGTPGYWLSWIAVDTFEQRDGRKVTPGVDYQFSPTPAAPSCAPNVPAADFAAPGARSLSKEEMGTLAQLFKDQPLTGGQVAPRLYRWVNENVSIFLQFDSPDMQKATSLRYVGISVRGEFCQSKQPSADFPHFHRTDAAEYAKGHGQAPGDSGYWLLWMATDTFAQRDGRQVKPGIDRQFSPTPPPACAA